MSRFACSWFELVRLSCFSLFFVIVRAWPDGAPCIHAAYESMNPLEAVEHQGGLQMTDPPFHIEVDRECYWLNQPIGVTLRGNGTKDRFKGFAVQPIVWKGSKFGKRIGQFMRLDDNGSWQQQCFRKKDSITHSHDEKKTQIKVWWKNDEDDSQYVQFVGTVVVHLKQFWVKSVLSPPIPPCRVERRMQGWQKPAVTVPPPVGQFKMDTWRLFNHESAGTFPRSISSFPESQAAGSKPPTSAPRLVPPTPRPPVFQPTPRATTLVTNQVTMPVRLTPAPPVFQHVTATTAAPSIQTTFVRPSPTSAPEMRTTFFRPSPQTSEQPHQRQKLTHVIPLADMEINRRHKTSGSSQPVLVTIAPRPAPRLVGLQETRAPMTSRLMALSRQVNARLQFQQQRRIQMQMEQQMLQQPGVCIDLDPPSRCLAWVGYCNQGHPYMMHFCRRTCRLC